MYNIFHCRNLNPIYKTILRQQYYVFLASTNENQTLKECPNLENEIYDVRKELLILHKNQIYELYGERNNLKTFLRTTWGVRTNLMEFFRANEMTEENNAFMNYMLDFGK